MQLELPHSAGMACRLQAGIWQPWSMPANALTRFMQLCAAQKARLALISASRVLFYSLPRAAMPMCANRGGRCTLERSYCKADLESPLGWF